MGCYYLRRASAHNYTVGEDKGGLLGPQKDKYKVCLLLDKANPKFWVQAAEDSQFCQAIKTEGRA